MRLHINVEAAAIAVRPLQRKPARENSDEYTHALAGSSAGVGTRTRPVVSADGGGSVRLAILRDKSAPPRARAA